MDRRSENKPSGSENTGPKIHDFERDYRGSSGERSGSQGPQVGDKRSAPSSDNEPKAKRELHPRQQKGYESEEESFATRNYGDSSSSDGEESHDTIKNIRPHKMNSEQKGIYANDYGIKVEQVSEHWKSMQEKRVEYARDYVGDHVDVTSKDSPLEILGKVNQGRIREFETLDAFDKKAQSYHELRKTGGDDPYSSEDERQQEQARQMLDANVRRDDSLLTRTSKTYQKAREAYESDRQGPNV